MLNIFVGVSEFVVCPWFLKKIGVVLILVVSPSYC